MEDKKIMDAIHKNSKRKNRITRYKKIKINPLDKLCFFISFLTFIVGLTGLIYVLGG